MTRSHEDTELRDRIATAVLPAIVISAALKTAAVHSGFLPVDTPHNVSPARLSAEAYILADAMLRARETQ